MLKNWHKKYLYTMILNAIIQGGKNKTGLENINKINAELTFLGEQNFTLQKLLEMATIGSVLDFLTCETHAAALSER